MEFKRRIPKPLFLILCAGLAGLLIFLLVLSIPDAPVIHASHSEISGEIQLTWKPVEGATLYTIYRRADGDMDYRRIHTTSDTEFTDTTAENGLIYHYYVKAVSPLFLPSGPSAEARCASVLPQPTLALVTEASSGCPKILWDHLEGTAHYALYRSVDGENWDLLTTTTETEIIDSQTEIGTEYYYRLQAIAPDPAANSSLSEAGSLFCCLPCPVARLDHDRDSGYVVLQWEPVADALQYTIFRSNDGKNFSILDVVKNPLFMDLTAIPTQQCFYQIMANGATADINSGLSPSISGSRCLARPEVTASNEPATGSILLSWEPVEGAVGYEVFRAAPETGQFTLLGSTEEAAFSDTDTTRQNIYFYRVLARAEQPESNSALSVKVRGIHILPSPVITNTGNEAGTGAVELSWTAVEGAVKYEVLRADNPGGEYKTLDITKNTHYKDTSGIGGTQYSYKVLAIAADTVANSAASAEQTRYRILPCPTITVSNHATKGRVKISWDAVEGAIDYQVFRAADREGDYRFLASSDNTVCLDTTGAAGQTYYYKVMAMAEDSEADSALSEAKSGIYHYLKTLTLEATTNRSGKPALEWNEVENAVKYRVYRSLLPSSGFQLLATVSGTSYTNSNAAEGVTFYYRVKALDKDGDVIKTSNNVSALSELLKKETLKTRYVKASRIWLYAAPDVSSERLPLRYMERLKLGRDVAGTEQATWYRCFYDDQLYYLRIEKDTQVLTTEKSKFQYRGETKRQQQIIDLALKISQDWKTTYAHNQSNGIPNSKGVYGFDCTGLVKYIFGTVMQKTVPTFRLYADIDTLYQTTSIYNAGYPGEFFATDVKKKNIQPGDILFFTSMADGSDSDKIGHCGIYLGNNEFVHSTSAWSDAVCIVPLSDSYLENLVAIRRYLPKTVTPANTVVRLRKDQEKYALYTERSQKSEVVTRVPGGDKVTVLFTDNADWAYVQAENGKKGFIQVRHFK